MSGMRQTLVSTADSTNSKIIIGEHYEQTMSINLNI